MHPENILALACWDSGIHIKTFDFFEHRARFLDGSSVLTARLCKVQHEPWAETPDVKANWPENGATVYRGRISIISIAGIHQLNYDQMEFARPRCKA